MINQIPKNIEWDVQRFNGYPFFLSSAAMLSGFEMLPWKQSYTHFLSISHNANIEWYYDKADYERIGNIFWKKIKSKKDIDQLIEKYNRDYINSLKNSTYNQNLISKYSLTELQSILKKQTHLLRASGGVAHVIECASYVAEKQLNQQYKEASVLISASKQSFLNKAALFAKKLLQNNSNDNKKVLEIFTKKYGWIKNSYLGRNSISVKDIREIAYKGIILKKDKPKKDKLLDLLSILFSWQDDRKANLLKSIHTAEPILFEIAKRLRIPNKEIVFLLPNEIDLLTNKSFQKELKRRSNFFIDYSNVDGSKVLLSDEEGSGLSDQSYLDYKDIKEMKGSIAFKGCVKGIVRVCLSLESISLFKVGEILVASMTRPEYITSMKKAAAFVTDEGGITCHAAIVARELKKPCIIGTKIATKVLKDGDLVEVDAEKGIVRIIERK